MTFKEKFPMIPVYITENFKEYELDGAEFCFCWMVEERCIDKKQFKEIIERTAMHIGTHSCEIMEKMLIKELELKTVQTGTESEVLKRNESTNKN